MKTIVTSGKAIIVSLIAVLMFGTLHSQQPASLEFKDYNPKTVCQGGLVSLTFVAVNGSGQGQNLKYQDSIHQPGAQASLYQLTASGPSGNYTLVDWFWTTGITYPVNSNQASPPITIQVQITANVAPGTYNLTLNSLYPTGTSSNSASLVVTAAAVASISFPASTYCQSGTAQAVISGYAGSGSFSGSTGLVISSTGLVDLASTPPGNYTVTYTYTEAPCPARFAYTTITIDQPSAGGTAAAATSPICTGSSTTINLTGYTGSIQRWEYSTNGGSSWTTINSTSANLSTGALTTSTQFRAVVKNGACAEVNSSVATVNVDASTAINSQTTSAATYCQNAPATALSVNATGTNLTYQWYSNAAASNSGGTLISGATGATYTPSTATAGTTYYYVVVTGTCGVATSNVSGAILVNATTVINSQTTPAATYCQNAPATALSVSATGTSLTYQWYSNTSAANNGGTLISGATAATYTSSTATAGTTYYYVTVNGTCGSATSNVSGAILVNATTVINGQTSPAATYCQNAPATALSVTATGTNLTYQWYSNASAANSGGSVISGATGATYTPSTATAGTTYYYVVVTGTCGVATSNVSGAILVNATTVINSQTTPAATYCQNAPATALSVSATGTNLTYQWYSNAAASNSGGALISGATGATYTPATATAGTTYYYVVVSGTCGVATSNVSGAILVNATTVVNGQTSPAATYCQNAPATALIVNATGTSLAYQWYSNAAQSNSGGTLIGGATAATYTPSTATAGTTYYYVVINGTCGTATSAISGAIQVNATTVINSQTTPAATYCRNAAATALSVNATGTNLTYQWYSNAAASNSGGTLISGATAATYTPSTATAGTTYYYVVVTGTCGVATSNVSGAILVNATTVINSQTTPAATYCQNAPATALSVSATGTNLTYQWYSNAAASNSGGALISGATGATFTPSTATAGTTYYYVVVTGTCGVATSNVSGAILVNATTVINSQTTPAATYCQNAPATALSVSATGTNLTYQWYSNASANNSGGTLIGGAMAATYTPSTATAGTTYYYVVVTGTCGVATSNVSGAILVNATTVINGQTTPAATYCQNAPATALSVSATGTNLTYQWYSNTSAANSGGSVISGATGATYTPSTATAGTTYYYVVVTGTCGVATSNISGAILVHATTTITASSMAANTYCQNATATMMSVTAVGNNLTYQWYRNNTASNSGGTLISGATAATFVPSTTTAGTTYYYVVVNGTCGTATSNVSGAILVNATTVISGQTTPAATYCQDAPATALSVTATGTNITYQWYSNTTSANTGGTVISGATNSTYSPSTTTAGTTYYYVVVSGTCGVVNSAVSGAILVYPTPAAPTVQASQYFCSYQNPTIANLSAIGANIQWAATPGGSALAATVALTNSQTYYATQTVNGCVSPAAAAHVTVAPCTATFRIDRIDPSCPGQSNGSINIQLTGGGTAPFDISFDEGKTYERVPDNLRVDKGGLPQGIYNIFLRHSDGFIQPLSTTSLIDPQPVTAIINTQGSITCTANTVTLTMEDVQFGAGAPYSFSINGGAYSTTSVYRVGAGVYAISVTDRNGCIWSLGSVSVAGVDNLQVATQSTNVTSFGGSNGSIRVTVSGGSGSYMITLIRPNGSNTVVNAGVASTTFNGLVAGVYTVTVSDNNGCGSIVRTVNITQPEQAPLPPDLVLGSESNINTFDVQPSEVHIVYNVVNASTTTPANGVVLRITKPTPGYAIALGNAATYNMNGTVYTLDNSRWTKTADTDTYVEISLNNDPGGQNFIPAQMFVPKRLYVIIYRGELATGKGAFGITGTIRSSVADNFPQDNATVHVYDAQ